MRIPVENLETKLIAYHQVSSLDIHGWAVFDAPLNLELLRGAIRALCDEFPVLKSRVVPNLRAPYYQTLDSYPPLEILQLEWKDPFKLPRAAFRFVEEHLELEEGPLVKFFYLESADRSHSFLSVKHNHCAADGRGLVRIFEILAKNYTDLEAGREINRRMGRTDRSLKAIFQSQSFLRNRLLGAAYLQNLARMYLGDPPARLRVPDDPGGSALTPLYLLGNEAERIRGRARTWQASVNDLLTAALAFAISRYNRRTEKLRFLIPQDLRIYGRNLKGVVLDDGFWLPVANIVGNFYIDLEPADFSLRPRLASAVRRGIQHARRTHMGLAAANYLAYDISYVPIPLMSAALSLMGSGPMARFLPVSTLFSNVGRIPPEAVTFHPARPVYFSGSLPFMPGMGVVATSAGMRDCISLTLNHNKEGFAVEEFVGYLREFWE